MSLAAVPAATQTHSHERFRGIVSMISAVCVFSIMDSLMKRLSTHYGPFEISCLRCLSSLLCIVVVVARRGTWSGLRADTVWLHLVRAALGVCMLASFIFAVHLLTMAQTYSVFLAAPLIMTALSVPLLHEQVSGRRWLAILIGMSGVLVILQPWGHSLVSWPAAAAAAAATICYSLSALTVRSLGRSNSSMSMVFWYLAMVGTAAGLLAIGEWRPVEPGDWKWLAAIGVSGALGQFWLTDAFRRAPPSVVAPFEYTALLWAFAIDWVFWSAAPSGGVIAGAAIVIATGTFVIWDEHRSAERAINPGLPPP